MRLRPRPDLYTMKEDAEHVTLARITRPRGNKGEVAAENLSDGLRYFAKGGRLQAVLPDRTMLEVGIDSAWEHKGRLILKFEGFETISDAERLRFAELKVRKDALETPPEGEYFLDDLIGCRMVDQDSCRELGTVADVYEPPGGLPLFSVEDSDGKELLVPFAREICREVDVESKRIAVCLPAGMEDLKA